MKKIIILLLISFSSFCIASEENISEIEPKNVEENTTNENEKDRSNSTFSFLLTYSPLDLWLPFKYGFAASYNHSTAYTFEFDYIRGTVKLPIIIEDLGDITEQRFSFLVRSFGDRESFNWHYGLNYYSFKVRLGNAYLDLLSGQELGVDVVRMDTIGLNWGLGNRWQIKNFVFGIDWFAVDIPIVQMKKNASYVSNSSDAGKNDDIDTVLDIIRRIPRFAFVKLQAGLTF